MKWTGVIDILEGWRAGDMSQFFVSVYFTRVVVCLSSRVMISSLLKGDGLMAVDMLQFTSCEL